MTANNTNEIKENDNGDNFKPNAQILAFFEDDSNVSESVAIETQIIERNKNENNNNNKEDNTINKEDNKDKQINENQKPDKNYEKKYTYEGMTPKSIEIDNKNYKNQNSNNFIETLNDVITHQKDDEDNNFNLLNNDNDNLNKDKKNEQNEKKNKDNDNDTFVFQKVEQTESLFAACSIMDSVNISEELPNEIHNHALEKDALKNETCTMCLNKKTCENGYKCYLCPLIICDECSTKMRLYSISNNKHEHLLCLLNEENCKCNKCSKELHSKKNYYFNCSKCNYNLCLKCYFPERREDKEENDNSSIHEHPLKNVTELNLICKLCEKPAKSGTKCSICELTLCQDCWNRIMNHKKRNNLHEHPLFLNLRNNWNCEICSSKFNNQVSFNCNKCAVDFCVDCFLE